MKSILTSLIFTLMLIAAPAASYAGFLDSVHGMIWGTNAPNATKIDVLLLNDQPGVMIEVQGKYKLYDPYANQHLGTRVVGKKKMMQGIVTGLKWGEEFPGVFQLQIIPEDPMTKITVNGIEYPGTILVYEIGGSISVINQVDIEDYLICTMSHQQYQPLPEETFASIAIVARTYALYESKNPKSRYWAVDAQHIGYQGNRDIDTTSHVATAIKATRGMVLSATGAYEGKVTPIAAQWGPGSGSQGSQHKGVFSHISLFEAEELGKNGKDASTILSKAFPEAHIELLR